VQLSVIYDQLSHTVDLYYEHEH